MSAALNIPEESIKNAREAAAANLAAMKQGHNKLQSAYQKNRTSEYKEKFVEFPVDVPVKAHPRLYTTASELFGQCDDAVDPGKWRSEQQASFEKSYSAAQVNAGERAGFSVVKDNIHPTFFAWHRMDRYADANAKDPCGPPGGMQQNEEYVEDANVGMSEYNRQYKWLPIDAQAREEGHRHGAESVAADGAQRGLTLLPNYDVEANETTWATETRQKYVPVSKDAVTGTARPIAGKASFKHEVIPTFYAWEESAVEEEQQQPPVHQGSDEQKEKEQKEENGARESQEALRFASEFFLPTAGKPSQARGPSPYFYAWENGSGGAGPASNGATAQQESTAVDEEAAGAGAADLPVAGAPSAKREAIPFFYAWDPDAAAQAIVDEEQKAATKGSYDGDVPAGKPSNTRVVPPTFYAWDPEGAARSIAEDALKTKSKSARAYAAEAAKRGSENDSSIANVRNSRPDFMLLKHPTYFAWGPDADESSPNSDPHARERHMTTAHSESAENYLEWPPEVILAAKASPVRKAGDGNISPSRNTAATWKTEHNAKFKPFPLPKDAAQQVAGVSVGAATSSSSAAMAATMRASDATTALWRSEYDSRYIPLRASYERPKTAPPAATAPPATTEAVVESQPPSLKPATVDYGAEVDAAPVSAPRPKSATSRRPVSASREFHNRSTKTVETRRGKAAARNDNLVDTSATTVSWRKVPVPSTQRFDKSSPQYSFRGPSSTASNVRRNAKAPKPSWAEDEVIEDAFFNDDADAGASASSVSRDVDNDGVTMAADSLAATAGRHLNAGEGVSHASLAPSASSAAPSASVAGATGAPTDDAEPLSGRSGSERPSSAGLKRPATADSTMSRRSGSSLSSGTTVVETAVPSSVAGTDAKQKEAYLRAPFATTDKALLKNVVPITAETYGVPNPRRSSFSGAPQTESQYQQASGRVWHAIPNRMSMQDSAAVDSGYRQEVDPATQRSRSVPTVARRITQSTLAPNPVKAPSRQASWADESFNPLLFNKRYPTANPHHQATKWQTESHSNFTWKQPESSVDATRKSTSASELAMRASKAPKRAVSRFARTSIY